MADEKKHLEEKEEPTTLEPEGSSGDASAEADPDIVQVDPPDDDLTPEQLAAREAEMERAMAIIEGKDPDAPDEEQAGEPDGEPAGKKKGFPKRAAALIAVVVVALVAVGAAFALQPAPEQEQVQDVEEAVVEQEEPEPGTLSVALKADGWEKGKSTPAVLKATGANGDSYAVVADLAQPVEFAEDDAVERVEAIGPVNADGSFFKGVLQVAEPSGDVEFSLEPVPADKVTQADADAVMAALEGALASGQIVPADADGLADAFSANLKAAPGVDAKKVEEQAQAAEQAVVSAQEAGSAQSGAASGSKASSSASADGQGSSAGGSASSGRTWVPEKGHNERVLKSAAWDEPVYDTVSYQYCKLHQERVTDVRAHDDAHPTDNCTYGVVTENVQVDTIHHDAVYDTKWVVDEPAHWE